MKLSRALKFILATQLFMALPTFAQDAYKTEAAGPPAFADLPKALQDALDTSGARLVNAQGAPICELWLRKSIPTTGGAAGSGDTLYAGLSVGTMVGVLRLPNGGSDFRGQSIKPGFYTLRYALIPQDGNHLGVSVYRDFLLLGPAAGDTDAEKPMTFDDAVKLSRQASGTGHPAILSLGPATDAKSLPALVRDDQGHWVLQVKVQGKSPSGEQDFPIGIILVGKAEA